MRQIARHPALTLQCVLRHPLLLANRVRSVRRHVHLVNVVALVAPAAVLVEVSVHLWRQVDSD